MKNVEDRKSILSEKEVLGEFGECVPKSSARVLGRQSNHGDFTLPRCLSHLVNPPLYIAVAHWGLLKKTPFSRDDISQAFRITPRRAADVMTYIQREHGDVITCVRHLQVNPAGIRCLTLQVTGVAETPQSASVPRSRRRAPDKASRGERQKKSQALHNMRATFLARPLLSPVGSRTESE